MASPKIIPLAEQPEYQAAIGNVVQISVALSRKDNELERLQSELHRLKSSAEKTANTMAQALAIAANTPDSHVYIPPTLYAEIDRLSKERNALQAGLVEANKAADAVAETLSRSVAAQVAPKQAEAVKRILECLEQLCEANKVEEKVRHDLDRLGYHRHGLQNRGFLQVGAIDDWTGSPAYYFNREAKAYLGTR